MRVLGSSECLDQLKHSPHPVAEHAVLQSVSQQHGSSVHAVKLCLSMGLWCTVQMFLLWLEPSARKRFDGVLG
jgi:hypothetical protein